MPRSDENKRKTDYTIIQSVWIYDIFNVFCHNYIRRHLNSKHPNKRENPVEFI